MIQPPMPAMANRTSRHDASRRSGREEDFADALRRADQADDTTARESRDRPDRKSSESHHARSASPRRAAETTRRHAAEADTDDRAGEAATAKEKSAGEAAATEATAAENDAAGAAGTATTGTADIPEFDPATALAGMRELAEAIGLALPEGLPVIDGAVVPEPAAATAAGTPAPGTAEMQPDAAPPPPETAAPVTAADIAAGKVAAILDGPPPAMPAEPAAPAFPAAPPAIPAGEAGDQGPSLAASNSRALPTLPDPAPASQASLAGSAARDGGGDRNAITADDTPQGRSGEGGERAGAETAQPVRRALRNAPSAAFIETLRQTDARKSSTTSFSGSADTATDIEALAASSRGVTMTQGGIRLTQANGPAGNVPLSAPAIAAEITRAATNGRTRFEIRLDPPELGRIDVKLDISDDGRIRTHLTVERSETLDLLQRDARGLERALQQAGLKSGDGGLQFSLRDDGSNTGRNAAGGDSASRDTASAAADRQDEANPSASAPATAIGRYVVAQTGLDLVV